MCALLASVATAAEEQAPAPASPENAAAPAIVCLHTEFYPLPWEGEKKLSRLRIVRELGRQAVLIAARDELGLLTRDETLGEPFPEQVTDDKKDLHIKVRSYLDGDLFIHLAAASSPPENEPEEGENAAPLTKLKHSAAYSALINLTAALEKLSHNELPAKLQELGFHGNVPAANEENAPPDSVEDLLLDMNFVAQYAAVRAAHAAIAQKGQSNAWLGVLARGYANLALMTEHHWKSDNEVFAARALLYAERMVNAAPQDVKSRVHRAYVRAIVGLHEAALRELQELQPLTKIADNPQALPAWSDLIDPFCSFERQPLLDISARRASLRQLAERLSFEQHRAYGDDRWTMESARRTMGVCPQEYGIYAALAVPGAPLGVGRMGAYYAPAALGHFLPQRIAALDNLPETVRKNMQALGGDQDGADKRPPDPNTDDVFSIVPAYIAQDLRSETEAGNDTAEPSWSVLGDLIAEEQFVQAANYLQIATNATESSLADDVAGVLPLVKGHRYARYIESYGVNMNRETARYYEVINDLHSVDPRANMMAMFWRTWRAPNSKGQHRRGYDEAWHAFIGRNLTFPGMLESYEKLGSTFWNRIDPPDREMFARDFRRISPHSPQALRLQIMLAAKPTYEQAVEWEGEAGEDPQVMITLGALYQSLQQYEDSIRCFERSIELSPSKEAFVGLAEAHRASGQEDLWQPTLERFFEVENLGLEHAQVHSLIARELIARGKLEEAEPHAAEAAQTWAAWGLGLASEVYEGLGRWEESEQWIRENSTSYPTSSGDEWYFWCRRTGRGDADAARKLTETFYAAEWIKNSLDGRLRHFVFHLLEDDASAALEEAQAIVQMSTAQNGDADDMTYYQMHLALVAHELKKDDIEKGAIAGTKRLIDEQLRKDYVDFSEATDAFCKVLAGEALDDQALATLDRQLENLNKESRCNYEYFIGRAYDLNGNQELADKYWKRAVTRGPYTRYNATLAGNYLSARHGTSRP